jgi:two-component system sensor histidine kinase DevS
MDEIAGTGTGLADELLKSIVNAAPDGILVVDANGIIQLANPMATRLFGYDGEELVGLPVDRLLPEQLRAGHGAHRARYVAHPRPRAMGSGLDLRAQSKSGAEIPVEIALSPVGAGNGTHVIAIVRDVTERRAASEELMTAHEQLALVDDRERIARDLHDTVIQRLFAVGLSLQAALSRTADADTAERVETAINEIDATIRDIRTAIFSLHARRATATGLRDDVLSTAREAGRALGFEPRVEFDGPVDSATEQRVREELVPTLREALSNVVKHAGAQRVSVLVAVSEDDIVLEVVDDGIGPATSSAGGGRGLGNMNERALALGGRCEVRGGDAGGTRVLWRVPRG